jgi:NADPH:quinone reductase-like Zn-dependent oxidoreductase
MSPTMQVIQLSRTGGSEVLEVMEDPVPRPGPGKVLINAHAIGVAYFDMLIRTGRFPWSYRRGSDGRIVRLSKDIRRV